MYMYMIIYTHTPHILRIQQYTSIIFMHVFTNCRLSYTHIYKPSQKRMCFRVCGKHLPFLNARDEVSGSSLKLQLPMG